MGSVSVTEMIQTKKNVITRIAGIQTPTRIMTFGGRSFVPHKTLSD